MISRPGLQTAGVFVAREFPGGQRAGGNKGFWFAIKNPLLREEQGVPTCWRGVNDTVRPPRSGPAALLAMRRKSAGQFPVLLPVCLFACPPASRKNN